MYKHFRLLLVLLFVAPLHGADLKKLHEQVLRTQVRVTTAKAGGSGTVIWSQKVDEYFSTYIITCHHVISDAIKLADEWNPLLQRQQKRELRDEVMVEFFQWDAVPHGKSPLRSGVNGSIIAYDPGHDMALLHLRLSFPAAVAKLLPRAKYEEPNIGSPVVAVGCALLHDPILTSGEITHMGDVKDFKDYWMSNANIIFGNSGGAVFYNSVGDWYFIGIPSLVDVIGWGTPITHLGYFSPITRIQQFLEEQVFDFIVPGSPKTEAQCANDRKARLVKDQAK